VVAVLPDMHIDDSYTDFIGLPHMGLCAQQYFVDNNNNCVFSIVLVAILGWYSAVHTCTTITVTDTFESATTFSNQPTTSTANEWCCSELELKLKSCRNKKLK